MRGFVLLIVLLSNYAFSQPVLTSEMLFPALGDRVVYSHVSSTTTYFSGGLNRMWDFSSLSFLEKKDTLLFLDPSETPYRNYFINSSFSERSNSHHVFYQLTANGQYRIGSASDENYSEFFPDPELVYPSSIAYGHSVKDSFSSTHIANGISYEKQGERDVSYIGYGTLVTDNDVIDSVILLQVSRTAVVDPGGIESSSEYFWISKNDPYPVMHSRVYKSGNSSETILRLRSSVVNVTAIADKEVFKKSSRIHFDSATSSLILYDEEMYADEFIIYNSKGEMLISSEVRINDGRKEIILPRLASGFYFTMSASGRQRFRFVVP